MYKKSRESVCSRCIIVCKFFLAFHFAFSRYEFSVHVSSYDYFIFELNRRIYATFWIKKETMTNSSTTIAEIFF